MSPVLLCTLYKSALLHLSVLPNVSDVVSVVEKLRFFFLVVAVFSKVSIHINKLKGHTRIAV